MSIKLLKLYGWQNNSSCVRKGNVKKKKKCKESKDKLIILLSDYFDLHKILKTANSEDQYFSRHPGLKVDLWIPVYERVGVSLVDLWNKVGKSVIAVCGIEGPKRCILYLWKRQDNFLYVKGVSFVLLTKCDSKGVLFLLKLVYKRVRDWTSGRSPPVQKFVETPGPDAPCNIPQLETS